MGRKKTWHSPVLAEIAQRLLQPIMDEKPVGTPLMAWLETMLGVAERPIGLYVANRDITVRGIPANPSASPTPTNALAYRIKAASLVVVRADEAVTDGTVELDGDFGRKGHNVVIRVPAAVWAASMKSGFVEASSLKLYKTRGAEGIMRNIQRLVAQGCSKQVAEILAVRHASALGRTQFRGRRAAC